MVELLARLETSGVATLDLYPLFRAARASDEAPALYCRDDTHWSPRGIGIAAHAIAARLGDRPWLQGEPRTAYTTATRTIDITGNLARMQPEPRPRESLPLVLVGEPGGGALVPPRPDRTSPVLLLGDSHVLVFHAGEELHASGAGLPERLAFELGFAVDVVGVRGSGATPSRVNLMRRGAKGLAGKRVVVWCLAARELSESVWSKVELPLPPAFPSPSPEG